MKSKPQASYYSIIIITSTIKVVFIVLIDILNLYFFPSSLLHNLLLWLTLSLWLFLPLLLLLEIIAFVFLFFLLRQVVLRAIEVLWWLLFFKEVARLLGLKETTRFFFFSLLLLYWGNLYPLHSFFWILLLDQVKNLKKIIDLEKLKAERLQDNLTDHESNQTLIHPEFFESNPKTLLWNRVLWILLQSEHFRYFLCPACNNLRNLNEEFLLLLLALEGERTNESLEWFFNLLLGLLHPCLQFQVIWI